MRKSRLYLHGLLFGGVTLVLFAVLALTTVRDAERDKAAILNGALREAPEHGDVLGSDAQTTVTAFPAHFAEVLQRTDSTHAHGDRSVERRA